MAGTLENIKPAMLKWAVKRAGYSETEATQAFARLGAWLSGEKKPTLTQLKKFAEKFLVPVGYLFLQDPPRECLPFPMFRGAAGNADGMNLNVYDTVMAVRGRQEWLEDYITDNDIEPCRLVGVVTGCAPVRETVARLRQALKLDERWAYVLRDVPTAIAVITQRLEDCGVFVAFNGVVGNNTRRAIKVDECRGFALVSKNAPYIFVNSADSKNAQMFTIIHETAHLMLGVSAGHAGEEMYADDATEKYCDRVAAEFLVPQTLLMEVWNGDIAAMASKFKVSEIVIARRAHDIGLINDEQYHQFYMQYKHRAVVAKTRRKGGGDFYRTSVKRVGRLLAIHIRNAVNSRQLSYTDAYRLTGLNGNTYSRFMANNI